MSVIMRNFVVLSCRTQQRHTVQHESVLLILADRSVATLMGKRDESGHSRVIGDYGVGVRFLSEFAG